jgi:hypothetical protein
MTESNKGERGPQDVFERLSRRGVPLQDYGTIKSLVALDVPNWRFHFCRQFPRRTITEVLDQIDRWKALLNKDFVLLPNQRLEFQKWIDGAEFLAVQTLIEVNAPQVGSWIFQLSPVPTGIGPQGRVYRFPAMRITAFNQETGSTRTVIIPRDKANSTSRSGAAYRKAFLKVGLWDLFWKGRPGRGIISARKSQGWPVFTHVIIPRLYEYLIPYYKKPGHHSNQIDSPGRRRPARYPQELMKEMLAILAMEHPHVFSQTTQPQLKAILQNYFNRNTKSIKSR